MLGLMLGFLQAGPLDVEPMPPEVEAGDTSARVMREWLPGWLKEGSLFGVEAWQWLAIGALILLAVLLDAFLRPMLRRALSRVLKRWSAVAEPEARARAMRPIALMIGGSVSKALLPFVGLTGRTHSVLDGAFGFFLVLVGVWSAWRIVDLGGDIATHRVRRTQTKVDDVVVPLIRRAAKIFVFAIGLVYVAESLDVQIGPLLASLGIGGLAFAFAAKDTIENFFGSIAVIIDRPFEVGDWVVIGDIEGTVEAIGFRSTRVRTFYDSMVTMPNATLVRAKVDNFGRRRYRRVRTHVGLAYGTPPDKILAFCEGVREIVRTHPYTRKDYYQVWLHEMAASSLNVLLYVFFDAPDWSTELRERERLFLDILRLADELGVEIAFPTQTLHVQQFEPGAPAELPVPTATSDDRAREEGTEAARRLLADQSWRKQRPGPVVLSGGSMSDDSAMDFDG
jgi:MscS family membrane protein